MNYQISFEENTLAVIQLSVESDILSTLKSDVLKKISSEVEVPGFRKGKAPVSTVEKQFQSRIVEEVVDEVVKRYYGDIIEKENLHVVSHPGLADMDYAAGSFQFKVEILPKAVIGSYKGLEIEKSEISVTDEMISEEINRLAKEKSTFEVVAEAAQLGDMVSIDFEGFIDGEAFPGGKAENYDLKLGTHSFIDTFEDQLVGKVAGESVEVNVMFPENYHSETLKGKPALFKVTVHSVKREKSVEINEEFAKEQGFDSVEAMKESKKSEITQRETQRVEREFEEKIIQTVLSSSEINVPKTLVRREVERNIRQFEQQLQMQGMSIDSYLAMTKSSKEDLYTQLSPNAEQQIKLDILLSEIAQAENLEVSSEELESEIEKIMATYNMTREQFETQLKTNGNYDLFLQNVVYERKGRKAVELLVSSTVVKG